MLTLNRLVILDLALVLTHQVDAAYWHEWEMFGLPGGIQLYCALNVLAFVLVLGLFVRVVQRRPSGFRSSLWIAAIGSSILPIHALFALAGSPQFHLPLSVFLIVATFVTSIMQVILTRRCREEFTQPARTEPSAKDDLGIREPRARVER